MSDSDGDYSFDDDDSSHRSSSDDENMSSSEDEDGDNGQTAACENKTSNLMTKYEFAAIIAKRAAQIDRGVPLISDKIPTSIDDSLDIATYELLNLKEPYPVRLIRPIDKPDDPSVVEIWDVRKMIMPKDIIKINDQK